MTSHDQFVGGLVIGAIGLWIATSFGWALVFVGVVMLIDAMRHR